MPLESAELLLVDALVSSIVLDDIESELIVVAVADVVAVVVALAPVKVMPPLPDVVSSPVPSAGVGQPATDNEPSATNQ